MSSTPVAPKRRVGIVGFGALGQFLVRALLNDANAKDLYDIAFVWNRTVDKIRSSTDPVVPPELILEDLSAFATKGPVDIIVEVSHPKICQEYGQRFLEAANLFVGSPTAFAEADLFNVLDELARINPGKHGMYFPVGALWGAEDIAKMAQRGTITGLKLVMTKPPQSMRLEEPLQSKLEAYMNDSNATEPLVLYDGPMRGLCPLAPNNVNTMACAALASGVAVGFDKGVGVLIADKKLEAHIIEVEVIGKPLKGRDHAGPFSCKSVRYNPCDPNAVTASATYVSFLSSLINAARSKGNGTHFC